MGPLRLLGLTVRQCDHDLIPITPRAAQIVEEWRVRRQAGDLLRSRRQWDWETSQPAGSQCSGCISRSSCWSKFFITQRLISLRQRCQCFLSVGVNASSTKAVMQGNGALGCFEFGQGRAAFQPQRHGPNSTPATVLQALGSKQG
jgi:hypothetical protein